MSNKLEEFRKYREKMNERILAEDNLEIRRFFALDTRSYEAGALDKKTKELLGLVASMVLRCDDCITYHVVRCLEEGATDAEVFKDVLDWLSRWWVDCYTASAARGGYAGPAARGKFGNIGLRDRVRCAPSQVMAPCFLARDKRVELENGFFYIRRANDS
jgi:AhpD family alkylhydroperoxidase